MTPSGRARGTSKLATILAGLGLVALLGYVGISWVQSTSDVLSPFRLLAASRPGYVITSPVELMARPRIIVQSTAVHSAEGRLDEHGPDAVARARKLILERPVIAIETGVLEEAPPAALLAALEPALARIATLDLQSLSIQSGTIKLKSSGGDAAVLRDVDLVITPQRQAASVAGHLTYLGKRLKLVLSVARPAARENDFRWPVQGTVTGDVLEVRFDGALAEERGLRLTGSVDLSVPRLREIALWIGMGAPRPGNLEGMRLRGNLDWSGGAMAFSEAALTLDGNEGVGAISVSREGERTAVEGTLAFKQLNLRPYIVSNMVERTLLAPIFAATRPPAIASLLNSLDADLRISSDALVIPGVEAGQGAVAITLKNGKLLADVAELAIEEGVFRGQVAVERVGTAPRYAVNGKLEGVEAGRLLQRALGRNPLQGRADITMSLTTGGEALADLVAGLGGKAQLDMRTGARLGLDLKALAQSAKRGAQQGWQGAGSAMIGLDSLALRFDAHKGVVHTTIVDAKAGASLFTGAGSIDLPARSVDFGLMLGRSDSAQSVVVEEILKLRGPWAAPSVRLEPAS